MNRYIDRYRFRYSGTYYYSNLGISLREFVESFLNNSRLVVKRISSQISKRAVRHNRLLPLGNRTRGDVDPTQQAV